ncbi:MAG: S41 family peptidase [Fimbriimonadales bacterium]
MLTPAIALFVASLPISGQPELVGPIKRARMPSLSPNGKQIAFGYQEDIWVVSSEGGRAERLTVHPATDSSPKWSPDGKQIAFSSNRNGSLDIFVMDADGGAPRRLTFATSNEYCMGWTPDSKTVLMYSDRWGALDICRVSLSGGEMIRMTGDSMELEFFPAVSPDGKKIAFCYGGGPGQWRRSGQSGSGTADIWIADMGTPVTAPRNITNDDVPKLWPMWAPDGKSIYYVGGSGTPNLWKMNPDGSRESKLTNYSTDRVRYASISGDGSKIAYEYNSEVSVFDTKSGKDGAIKIYVNGDLRFNDSTRMTLSTGVTDFATSPNGKRMLIGVRGDLFLMPEGGGTTRKVTNYAGRDEQPVWRDDSSFLFVSLRNGNADIFVSDLDGNAKPFVNGFENEMSPLRSPDGKWIGFHRGYGEICVVPAEGGTPKVVATGYFPDAIFGVAQFSWSPDSKHIVLTDVTQRGGQNIDVVDLDTGKRATIALVAKNSGVPKFTPDGRKVFFTADEYGESDLFVVDLVADPIVFSEDDLDKIDEKKPETGTQKFEIDMNGIFERMRRLTASAGGVGTAIASADSKTLYFLSDGQVNRVSITGGTSSPITTGAPKQGLTTSVDGKTIYVLEAGKPAVLNLSTSATSPRSFNADFMVSLMEDSKAIFEEVWWVMKTFFYDEKTHGQNWEQVKATYAAMVPHAVERSELYDMMQEMVHELNASHLGVTGPTLSVRTGDDATAIIGTEPDWSVMAASGEYKVTNVLFGLPASHPLSKIEVGETIVSVDGNPVNRESSLDMRLNQKAGRKTRIVVRNQSGTTRTVEIKPVAMSAQGDAIYNDFVRRSRALVDKYSGGKLAYLHIRAMSQQSHEQFIREVRTLTQGKQGLLIDVRYNGGGSTAHLALGMLIKKPWLYRTRRGWSPKISENLYRGDSVELPSALLINSASFSNAEIIAEGFRALGIGPVVGVATSGSVIGTSAWSLFDGGSVRTPMAGAYTVNGQNLEGIGRKPDFPVPYDPVATAAGEDPMLKKAVELVLGKVKVSG